MKRRLSILLAMVMVLSLCACGGTQSVPSGGDKEAAQEQTEGAEEEQKAAEPAAEA